MNILYLVVPILAILMFDLGLSLQRGDFRTLRQEPKAVLAGLIGQIVLLPLIAFFIGCAVDMPAIWFLGFMLIACSPGGSSSDVFTMLANGDVLLSVILTALSNMLTLITIPVVMYLTLEFLGEADISNEIDIMHQPLRNMFVQNIVLVGIPIAAGFGVKLRWQHKAEKLHRVLSKFAFPALILIALVFFVHNHVIIYENIVKLGFITLVLLTLTLLSGAALAYGFYLPKRQSRTVIIEVGMQNSAQAAALAISPMVFNNPTMAVPAIVYGLVMNIVILTYVGILQRKKS